MDEYNFLTILVIGLGLWAGMLLFDMALWAFRRHKMAAISVALIAISLFVLAA